MSVHPDSPARQPLADRVANWIAANPAGFPMALLAVTCLLVGLINPNFWQIANLYDLLRASVVTGLFALGVMVVLSSGGLDVSFTAIGALVMYAITRFVVDQMPDLSILPIMLASLIGGCALGLLNALPKPVIGRVQGQAFGGGIGLMAVCDVAVGVDGAKFGLTETRLGLIPATIGPYVLARMGEAMARRVFMSSRIFDAAEAVTLGLLARAVPVDDLDAAVEAEIKPYLACAPGAVASAKALALRLGGGITDEAVEHSIGQLVARWEGNEAAEGIEAFFARRKPAWAG